MGMCGQLGVRFAADELEDISIHRDYEHSSYFQEREHVHERHEFFAS